MSETGLATLANREARRRRLRQWRRHWIEDPVRGSLYYGIHHAARLLPSDACSSLGGPFAAFYGQYLYADLRKRCERIYRQLKGVPVSDDEAQQAVRRLFDNIGRTSLEFAVLDRLWAEGRIEAVGAQHLLEPRAEGRPVIVMGVHLANWETLGPTLIGLGLRGLKAFYQPPPNRFDEAIIVAARRRYGVILLAPGVASARAARRLLVEERGVFLAYADEERRGYVSAPLFGRAVPPRANIIDIARLAEISGAAVIPAYAERLGGARFRVTFLPEAQLDRGGGQRRDVLLDNVHRLDDIITPLIRDRLDQWYMLVEYRNRPYPA